MVLELDFYVFIEIYKRSRMDVSGESMDRKWPKEIHVLAHITAVPWPLVVPLENRYSFEEQ